MMNAHIVTILEFAIVLLVSLAVIVEDLRFRRIRNGFCLTLAVTAIFMAAFRGGWHEVGGAWLGCAVAFFAFLVPYGFGGMGGGDVKLMAAFGALIGIDGISPALVLACIAGALMTLAILLFARLTGRQRPESIPYSPAIVLGAIVVMLSHLSTSPGLG